MANSPSWTREIRFLLPPSELLEVFIFTESPEFEPAHGWRTKTFDKSWDIVRVLHDEVAHGKHLTEWAEGAPR